MQRSPYSPVMVLVLILLVAGCRRGQEAVIQARIAERVDAFRAKQLVECRTQLMRQAEAVVDSMLLTEAQRALLDSLARGRPAKPFKPGQLSPIDTVREIKPLFDQ